MKKPTADEKILQEVYEQCDRIWEDSSSPAAEIMKHLFRLVYDNLWELQKKHGQSVGGLNDKNQRAEETRR